jgi:hypothetical protein
MTAKPDDAVGRSGARVTGRVRAPTTTVEQLSRTDRVVARGKAARSPAPLESHDEFRPGRPRDPVGFGWTARGGSNGSPAHSPELFN